MDPYTRFGMDVEGARTLTRDDGLTDADLAAAEDDLADYLGGRPTEPDGDLDERHAALGRAVAWQATYRSGDHPPDGTEVTTEQWPDYTVSYRDGAGPRGSTVALRVVTILRAHGWVATAGYTHAGDRSAARDPWRKL